MILRLLLFAMFYGGLAVGLGAGLNALLRDPIERWRRRRLGKRNLALLEARQAETCVICDKPVDPEKDLFHERRGWHHATCFTDLLH